LNETPAAICEGRRQVVYADGEESRDFTPVAHVVAASLTACGVELKGKAEAKVEAKGKARKSRRASTSPSTSSPSSSSTSTSPLLLSNVAVGERYTLNFIVNEICRVLGKRVKPVYDPPRPGDVRHSLASVEVLTKRLGLTRRTTFVVGLEQLTRRSTKNGEPKAAHAGL
jgi:nucleoside-diphosphate-sugar epimerase